MRKILTLVMIILLFTGDLVEMKLEDPEDVLCQEVEKLMREGFQRDLSPEIPKVNPELGLLNVSMMGFGSMKEDAVMACFNRESFRALLEELMRKVNGLQRSL